MRGIKASSVFSRKTSIVMAYLRETESLCSNIYLTCQIWFHLTLKAPRKKMHLKMLSAEVVCCKELPNIADELDIKANSVDTIQTAPIGAVCSGSTLFVIEAS